ncbi:MAG: hypothetical protein IE931_10470 [Sphingobacteriales bacterium]|nr:hypothetical protein [Sphingobacteriales bacterium]
MIFKWKLLLITVFGFIVLDSCKTDNKSLNSICPSSAIASCAVPQQFFKIKFIDRDQLTDLLFGAKAKYHLEDLKIYSTRYAKDISFSLDSTEQNQKYIMFSTKGTDQFIIKLADEPKDNLLVETKYNDDSCCGQLNITQLTLNNSKIAFTNHSPTVIILKK